MANQTAISGLDSHDSNHDFGIHVKTKLSKQKVVFLTPIKGIILQKMTILSSIKT